jgi:hypothetical protein
MRFFSLSLAFAALVGSLAFADDANVLPQGVMRLRLIPSYSTMDKTFDKGGNSVDASVKGSLIGASGAFEFGVVNPVTVGIQWAPGYYVSSNFTSVPAGLTNTKMVLKGPDDVQIGAKFELVGPQGFVANDGLRIALTPGVSVPLATYDPKAQFDNFAAGNEYQAQSSSTHGNYGYGLKADADWMPSPAFYLNVHGQLLQYLPKEEIEFGTYATNAGTYKFLATSPVLTDGVTANPYYGNAAAAKAAADSQVPLTKTKTTYGQEYTIEVEPHFTLDLGGGNNVGASAAFNYAYNTAVTTTYNSKDTTADPVSLLMVKPTVSCLVMLGPLPIETLVEYDYPLLGKNDSATATLSAQVRLFYKFY